MTTITAPTIYDTIAAINDWIDGQSARLYQDQPAAQDWARVAKCAEESGEAVAALIGMTGQNPRKGVTHTVDDLLGELADVAVTALAAIQHFTGDAEVTQRVLEDKVAYIAARAGIGGAR